MEYKWVWGDGDLELVAGLSKVIHHFMLLEKIADRLGHFPVNYVGGYFSTDDFHGGQFDTIKVTWPGEGDTPSADQIKYMIQEQLGRYDDRENDIRQMISALASVEDTEPVGLDAGFLKKPHKMLYPPVFKGTDNIPSSVAAAIKGHVLHQLAINQVPDADQWIYFTIYGSGVSYNWQESGDFDVQMWVDVVKYNERHKETPETADNLVAEVRRIVQMVNFPTFKDIGVDAPSDDNDGADGSMTIQYYPKPGEGTKEENLASKPYACYDLETGEWLQRPRPISPKFYGEHFLMVQNKAMDIAVQAESLFEELQRNTISFQFWSQIYKQYHNDKYKETANDARRNADAEKLGIIQLFKGVFGGRAEAYSPEGEGIDDERDIVQKYLEVWGVFQRLRHFAQQPLPWEEQDMPAPKEAAQTELNPHPELSQLATGYMQKQGLPYNPPQKYTPVDPDTAGQIAYDYENLEHNPQDPQVAESYAALKNETLAQYRHLRDNGYNFEFYPRDHDPYPNSPHQAMRDVYDNKHLYVYPTEEGFGSSNFDNSYHPMLETSPVTWNGRRASYNDLFRGVHDVFGHAKSGVGFRADGEENAWRQHSAMYSEQARPALTAETRGQNSWVNFGPYGEHNRGAGQADTWYADQKAGILPQWTSKYKTKTGNTVSFHKFADWSEIMQNAQLLRDSGAVQITSNGAQHVEGTVASQEDPNSSYQTSFERADPNSGAITTWNCSCPWGEVSWGRTRQWKKYEGRPCKHVLAMYWTSQATPLDEERPEAQGQGQLFNPQMLTQQPPGMMSAPVPGGPNMGPAQPMPAPAGQPLPDVAPTAPGPAPEPDQGSQITQPGEGGTAAIPGALSKVKITDPPLQKWQEAYQEALEHSGDPEVAREFADSSVNVHLAAFENGQVIRAKQPMWGIDRDGGQQLVPIGATGEVLFSDDNETIAIFPLNSGALQPHLVRVQDSTDNFGKARAGTPFVRRTR